MDRDELASMQKDSSAAAMVPVATLEPEQDTEAFNRARRRFPCEVGFFLLATLLTCFLLATHWQLYQRLNILVDISANLTQNANFTASPTLLQQYYQVDRIVHFDTACDVDYFHNTGFVPLQQSLAALRDACFAFFILALVPYLSFVVYRVGLLRELYYQRSRAAFSVWKPSVNPEFTSNGNAGNNPLGRVQVGDLTVPGQIRRSERVSLRGETSGYFTVQFIHEIPLLLIFFLFIAYVERYRGLDCAICYLNGESCYVPSYFSVSMLFSTDEALRWCLGATMFMVAWTYLSMCVRWIMYINSKHPVWPWPKLFMAWLLSTLVYVASFGVPIAILFAVYVGPNYYGFAQVSTAIGISVAGGALVLVGTMFFLGCAGVANGEGMMEALFCCNFCEVCMLACPCCDCMDISAHACGMFGPLLCPCCCYC